MNAEYGDRNDELFDKIKELERELATWQRFASYYALPNGRCKKCNFPINRGYICADCGTDPTIKE